MGKKLIIIRGLPGSGKTTYAKNMVLEEQAAGQSAVYLEEEMFFAKTHQKFHDAAQLTISGEWLNGQIAENLKYLDVVIVSNVCPSKSRLEEFKALADRENAEFEVYRLKTHWVDKLPKFALDSLDKRTEDWPGEIVILPSESDTKSAPAWFNIPKI